MSSLCCETTAEATRPRRKALVIGINYELQRLEDWDPISGQKDADRVYHFLQHDEKWNPQDIVLMKDHPETPPRLRPTRENLIRELKALVEDARAGDHFVLFFAGHSDQIDSEDPCEEDGKDEVLIPSDIPGIEPDYTKHAILDNQLREFVVDKLPIGSFLTAIFDACHSGTILDLSHYHCNSVYVPWVSRGLRRSRTYWERTQRHDAMVSERSCFGGPVAYMGARFRSQELQPELSVFRPPVRNLTLPTAKTSHLGRQGEYLEWITPASGAVRSMSPDPLPAHACTGWCKPPFRLTKAHVVCLSACADPERAWEADSTTMTSHLIDILRETNDHKPSYKQLLTELSHRLHSTTRDLHRHARSERWAARKKAEGEILPSGESTSELELDDFQSPQLSSHVPLDMHQPFLI